MLKQKTILDELRALKQEFDQAYEQLDIAQELKEIDALEQKTNSSEIWNDPEEAQKIIKLLRTKQAEIEPWQTLKTQIKDYKEILDVADDDWLTEVAGQLKAMQDKFAGLKKQLMFNGKYDKKNVILRITSGVGGDDAQDFAQMLERMYLRFFERNNFNVSVIERSLGTEAGIKTSVMEIAGRFAYGRLKSEHGVHRLVRKSPFNSDNLRHTSFALVEILPQLDENDVQLDEKDLKIDFFRSGGHGGQSVNTTDSAVRITHLPTGETVSIQNERSQTQNKLVALTILRAKLVELQKQQNVKNLKDLQSGESASWGMQVRNYVLHPYTIVKDTRTKYEETDVAKVLDGQIEGFIEAYLDCNLARK